MSALQTAIPQKKTTWHHAHKRLRGRRRVEVHLIGCGGNGARMLLRLANLDRALRELDAPGLDIKVYDGDVVTKPNLARQPFVPADVGQYKAVCLVHRINMTYGFEYEATPQYFGASTCERYPPVFLVSCVDSAKARSEIREVVEGSWQGVSRPFYHLDLGNDERTGQYVLGAVGDHKTPLPTCFELWPEIADPDTDDPDQPSCSSREALRSQDLFIHDVLSAQASNTLWRLFRDGRIQHHGGFCNLITGQVSPIPVPALTEETNSD